MRKQRIGQRPPEQQIGKEPLKRQVKKKTLKQQIRLGLAGFGLGLAFSCSNYGGQIPGYGAQVRVIRAGRADREQREEQERMWEAERKQQEAQKEAEQLRLLPAGTAVEPADIEKYGLSAYFTSEEIRDDVFARMEGKSFGEDCTVPREELRYLKVLYCGPEKKSCVGEMVCNKAISEALLEIFRELYVQEYPIERMVLVDEYDAEDLRSAAANNTSCFNFRPVAGPSGGLSYHARGLAVDINPLYNPYLWTDSEGVLHCEPEEGLAYADREGDFPYKIDEEDLCCRLFLEHGFHWGGSWSYEKDYMHFSLGNG